MSIIFYSYLISRRIWPMEMGLSSLDATRDVVADLQFSFNWIRSSRNTISELNKCTGKRPKEASQNRR